MKKTIAILFGALLVSNVAFAGGKSKAELNVTVNVLSTCSINKTVNTTVVCQYDAMPYNIISNKNQPGQAFPSMAFDMTTEDIIEQPSMLEVQQLDNFDVQTVIF